ncbi:hypothetical protein AB6A40_000260 [Gnathostoma spinigerum]|uniref:Uncharacterized protein n=1 Tax=Gnathostoma spinigerum TaxID=75299 RepID=A0ABD6E2Z8_9BILA
MDGNSEEPILPRYWFRFKRLTYEECNTWSEFRELKNEEWNPKQAISNRQWSKIIPDYDVYPSSCHFSNEFSHQPLFCLLVIDVAKDSMPKVDELRALSTLLRGEPLFLAVVRNSNTFFCDTDHRPVCI